MNSCWNISTVSVSKLVNLISKDRTSDIFYPSFRDPISLKQSNIISAQRGFGNPNIPDDIAGMATPVQ